MDFQNLDSLDFGKPDCETFKCLHLAFEAGKAGGTMPCVMNAANEVAVAKFLNDEIKFLQIPEIVERTMNKFNPDKVESLEQLSENDTQSRKIAKTCISHQT